MSQDKLLEQVLVISGLNGRKATRPCMCGYLGDARRPCECTPRQVQQYRSRISGPLLDRMDIQIEVPAVPYRDLSGHPSGDSSRVIKQRVERARAIQRERFQKDKIYCNAQMKNRHITKYCALDHSSQVLLERAMEGMGLSARAYHRILKIARTIADLEQSANVTSIHIAEAIQYRSLERKTGWPEGRQNREELFASNQGRKRSSEMIIGLKLGKL